MGYRAMFVVAGFGALAACGNGDSGARPSGQTTAASDVSVSDVSIEDFAFAPKVLEVDNGTTVRWKNGDDVLHTVTSGDVSGAENVPDGRFDLRLDGAGEEVSYEFSEPGTYTYYCSRHNAMTGEVRAG